jgi:hypothetical protein
MSGCSYSGYIELNGGTLKLNNDDNSKNIELKNDPIHKSHFCTVNSYTIEEKEFHLEYIKLANGCSWSGYAEGIYQDFLKDNYKNIEKTSILSSDTVSINRYSIDTKQFYLISLYDINSNTFILDYSGDIAKVYSNDIEMISQSNRVDKLQQSLLDKHLSGYFEKDRQKEDSTVTIPMK